MGEAGVPDQPMDEAVDGPRPAGPDPQGAPPYGAFAPSGPSHTGHPPPAASAPATSSADHPAGEGDADDGDGDDEDDGVAEPSAVPTRRGAREMAKVIKERDDYLEQLKRTRAEFENYRKRILRQQSEHLARAAEALIEKLLPVMDNFDAAVTHGSGYEQVHGNFVGVLEREGLIRIDPVGQPFDPNEADAVAHEEGDEGPVVAEVFRPGYKWKGRVLRPAMVKVRG